MLLKVKYLLLINLALLCSCQDRHNISVKGTIANELGEPIQNAEVVVLCWYMSGLDDASFEKRTLTTDKSGNYQAEFAKGHQVDVASRRAGYLPSRQYRELKDNELEVNLQLARARSNPTLVSLMNVDADLDSIPSIRIRIYSGNDNKTLDLDHIETYGFDLKSLTTKADTSECDLWFKIERKESQPTIIQTNSLGGIIPVYANEINSSFLFEKPLAGSAGYKQRYTLKGNEEGFFVRCRDGRTYGKILLDKALIDLGDSDERGKYYMEFVREFSCLYQPNGSTDLSFSRDSLDLEDFLVDGRLR